MSSIDYSILPDNVLDFLSYSPSLREKSLNEKIYTGRQDCFIARIFNLSNNFNKILLERNSSIDISSIFQILMVKYNKLNKDSDSPLDKYLKQDSFLTFLDLIFSTYEQNPQINSVEELLRTSMGNCKRLPLFYE